MFCLLATRFATHPKTLSGVSFYKRSALQTGYSLPPLLRFDRVRRLGPKSWGGLTKFIRQKTRDVNSHPETVGRASNFDYGLAWPDKQPTVVQRLFEFVAPHQVF